MPVSMFDKARAGIEVSSVSRAGGEGPDRGGMSILYYEFILSLNAFC